MTSHPTAPIRSAAAWTGRAVSGDTSWIQPLTGSERDELGRVLKGLRGVPLNAINKETAALLPLQGALQRWREELRSGRGFVLVRGIPIEDGAPEEAARLYRLLGCHLGDPVPQNASGDLVCDIRDTGADPTNPNTRLYATRAEQDFHTDGADIIGLLALRPAKSGGISRIVSSVSVFNTVLALRPDLAPLLFDEWFFHAHGQFPPGFPAFFKMPICRWDGAHLATFFLGWYIRRAEELEGVPKLTSAQQELLTLFEATANDPALYLDMEFAPGDIQWLKNSVILHKRTAYEDYEEPERKRHLLRLWLTARDFADGDERLRAGIDVAAMPG